MNARPTRSSPPSSHGYASLELQVPPSLRLLALLGAWGAAACTAILRSSLPAGVRIALLGAFALGLLAGARRILPGAAGVSALRLEGDAWWVRHRGCWREAELRRALELPHRGWWLQWRIRGEGASAWAWLEAASQPARPYRALCRALRRQGNLRALSGGEAAGPAHRAKRESRRRSRAESRPDG